MNVCKCGYDWETAFRFKLKMKNFIKRKYWARSNLLISIIPNKGGRLTLIYVRIRLFFNIFDY